MNLNPQPCLLSLLKNIPLLTLFAMGFLIVVYILDLELLQ